MDQIPGNLGNAGKDEQIAAVPDAVAGMDSAFCDQEAVDRKSSPSDQPEGIVNGEGKIPGGQEHDFSGGKIRENECADMVDQHGQQGDPL